MIRNPIIEEVRAARAALAAEHGYDIKRINEWARQQTEAMKKASRQVRASREPRSPAPAS